MKSGYNDEELLLEERKINNTVPIYEQETNILYMRDEDFAIIYTSDTTQMTRFDKLCKDSPTLYELVEDTGRGKRYKCNDKSLISFRSKKREVILTEEQRQQRADNLRKARERK